MGRETKIAWCHHTFNGVRGCEHATLADGTESPGCQHCYAESMSKRNPAVLGEWGHEGVRVLGKPEYWAQLDRWHRAAVTIGDLRRVFCYSLGDVFESPKRLKNADVCATGRARLFDAIERLRPFGVDGFDIEQRGLIFLLLTKRPENVQRMVPREWLTEWPRHVWLGTSVENQQAADERIPQLLSVPGVPVRFLSLEPLLERVNLLRGLAPFHEVDAMLRPTPRIGWVIAGGESDGMHGSRARPCDLAWLRDLRDQCKATGVPFFDKQLGARPVVSCIDPGWHRQPCRELICEGAAPSALPLRHPKGEDPEEWPEDLRVREVPEVRL